VIKVLLLAAATAVVVGSGGSCPHNVAATFWYLII
jgi:hypothetical protein